MKKQNNVAQYIKKHKDEAIIFMLADKMFDEHVVKDDVIALHVIIYLSNLLKTKDIIINQTKVA